MSNKVTFCGINKYEDDYVEIDNGVLRIKLYYFPFGDKCMKISQLKKIRYSKQTESYAKNWGSSSLTWWACDMKRNFRSSDNGYYNVSVNNGDLFSKGFTVQDVIAFLRAMQNHLVGCEVGHLPALA